jgi:uncharacterized protein (DUF433 family)
MPTFLLTWNPAKWQWGDFLAEARVLKRGGKFAGHWSCGNSTQLRKGDRVFMMKQGPKPRGIVAAGWVTSDEPYDATHWEKDKRRTGKAARYVDIDFDVILNPETEPILGVEQLSKGALGAVRWGTQMGGIRIADTAAALLEVRWSDHLDRIRNVRPTGTDVVRDADRDPPPNGPGQQEAELLRRITVNPNIFGGKPIVRGHRLAVEHVLAMLAAGDTTKDMVENYPWLEAADITACLVYARRVVGQERIEPLRIETGRRM